MDLFEQFMNWLDEVGAVYEYDEFPGIGHMIYVLDKDASELKKKYPRKYKELYIPYIRLTHFGEKSSNSVYVRDNGWCEWSTIGTVKSRIVDCYI